MLPTIALPVQMSTRTRVAALLGALVVGTLAVTANGDATPRAVAISGNVAPAVVAAAPAQAGLTVAPFTLPQGLSATARARAETCLSEAIYYEAGQLDDDGQRGVGQVVLNRVRHPLFPASICGVVYEGSTRETGCQFTFTCDGSLEHRPGGPAWDRARRNARALLEGEISQAVGIATHYHADYVSPGWSRSMARVTAVGPHLFYGWRGGLGAAAAFTQSYSGREDDPAALRSATLAITRIPRDPAGVPLEVETVSLESLPGLAEKVNLTPYQAARALSPDERQKLAREAVEKAIAEPSSDS